MKQKNILVLNVGSSSLKFSFFSNTKEIVSGLFERIGKKDGTLILTEKNKVVTSKRNNPSYESAVKGIEDILKKRALVFNCVVHRVVHGGNLRKTSRITKKVENIIEKFIKFAPIHNPHELKVIRIFKKFKTPQFAAFDTAFYSELPKKASTYPIPLSISKKHNIKRYGFHGLSQAFVTKGIKGKTVSCHLGNGCSVAAVINGKPIDTSMGLTPLEGLMMGTRSGDIDPGLSFFLESRGYNTEKILNKKSGFLAFSKYTDMRDIKSRFNNKNIKLGFDIFVYRIVKYIGAYAAALNGLDNIIFTAGIGENVWILRKEVCKNLSHLKVIIDDKKNKNNELIISSFKSKVKVFVIKTNEAKYMVEEVLKLKW